MDHYLFCIYLFIYWKIKLLLDPRSNSLHSFEKVLKICQFVGNYDAKPKLFRTGAVTAAFELICSEYLIKKVDVIYIFKFY